MLAILAVFGLLAGSASASEVEYTIPSVLDRKGPANALSYGANPVIPGESTTTGLPLADKAYIPILVQIDNNLQAVPQWGLADADIMYESPVQGNGWTRLTALFSDKYPVEAGPVRSARVVQVNIREEWDAAYIFVGRQEMVGSDVTTLLKEYGVSKRGLVFDGFGNAHKAEFVLTKYHKAPHHVSVQMAPMLNKVMALGYTFPQRPFLFADNPVYDGLDARTINVVHNKNGDTAATYVYDESVKGYVRYTVKGIYQDMLNPQVTLVYNNLIIQRTRLIFNQGALNPVMPDVVGKGAADIFIGGKYIQGTWARKTPQDRTVFYDNQGKELVLQRGKSWIIQTDDKTVVTASGNVDQANLPDLSSMTEAMPAEGVDPAAAAAIVAPATAAPASTKPNPAQASKAVVTTRNKGPLNFREEARQGGKLINQIAHGTTVEVVEYGENWTKVRFEDKEGYVMTKYLVFK